MAMLKCSSKSNNALAQVRKTTIQSWPIVVWVAAFAAMTVLESFDDIAPGTLNSILKQAGLVSHDQIRRRH